MIRHATAIVTIGLIALLLTASAMADDIELKKLLAPDARVDELAGGMKFVEGPVWTPPTSSDGGYLIFSDIPASEHMRWDAKKGLSVFQANTQNANGNARDREGRLITCHHAARMVTRFEPDGSITVLADSFEAKKFNSPNDVVVKSDGTIWFTDPTYGTPKDEPKELPGRFVFRIDPASKAVAKVASDFDMPNGLCFSPDEKKLYIADSGKPHHIRVFAVKDDNSLSGGEVFCVIDKGVPDGIRCDENGNIWSTAGDGVHVFAPDGKLIGQIPVPETPANLCFGGDDGKTVFVTARTSLYAIKTSVRGASRAAAPTVKR